MATFTSATQRATGYKVTASVYNTDLVDNINYLGSGTASVGRPSVQASSSDTSTPTRSTWTLMTFTDTDDWDTASMHDTSTNTSRLVVPSGGGGLYRIWGRVSTDSPRSDDVVALMVRLNAAGSSSGGTLVHHHQILPGTAATGLKQIAQIDWPIRLSASDYVELFFWYTDALSTDRALAGGSIAHKFGMMWQTA